MRQTRVRLWRFALPVIAVVTTLVWAQTPARAVSCEAAFFVACVGGIQCTAFASTGVAGNCSTTTSNNATCAKNFTSPTIFLYAGNNGSAPSCAWTCTVCTGSIVIDGTDGLPVELMDFSVE